LSVIFYVAVAAAAVAVDTVPLFERFQKFSSAIRCIVEKVKMMMDGNDLTVVRPDGAMSVHHVHELLLVQSARPGHCGAMDE
jgi:hypothetical protein